MRIYNQRLSPVVIAEIRSHKMKQDDGLPVEHNGFLLTDPFYLLYTLYSFCSLICFALTRVGQAGEQKANQLTG